MIYVPIVIMIQWKPISDMGFLTRTSCSQLTRGRIDKTFEPNAGRS